MKVAGIRSARYFSWSDASAPARVARLRLWISSMRTRSARSLDITSQTVLVISAWFWRWLAGSPAKRANSAASIFGVAEGGTVT